jgi:hypothetical protein
MFLCFRKWYEIWWLSKAIRILDGRNLARCLVVSRRDNNDMAYMAEQLKSIQKRMAHNYE